MENMSLLSAFCPLLSIASQLFLGLDGYAFTA